MSTDTRHVLLVNPSAGGGRALEVLSRAVVALRERAIEHRVVETISAEHGCGEARAAAEAGEIPVVISGDGLVGQIGGTLAGSGAVLGIIPGGRGNDLARVLGIPTDPEAAVDVLAAGGIREIDVGEVNGTRFLGIASCGFDSDANRIANEARLVKGRLVYAYAALRALAAWRPARFRLSLDGERREFSGYSVAAANSAAFGGGMFIAPDAELDDGLLDVVSISDVSKLRYLRGIPKVFDGSHLGNEEVSVVRAREVVIEADRPFAVYADGDHLADLPA
ncbi:MAG: diacylglycerol/lipid kinase family protein, partial [Solirubrobacterales bacterium]